MAGESATTFRRQLVRNHELACAIGSPGFALAEFEMLQNWQRDRLTHTYEDFLGHESDAPACRFFLEELYGGMNFRERDQEVARVEPLMTRMLPKKALHALADAFRLQAISLEFDMEMAGLLQRRGVTGLDIPVYAETYRECGRRPEREKQILLIRKLGHELQRLVKMPLLAQLLGALRGPARVAGFGLLQAFLENGLRSFRQLSDPALFVESIYEREWQAMNRLFSGHESPFISP
jgi:hypothetical protein